MSFIAIMSGTSWVEIFFKVQISLALGYFFERYNNGTKTWQNIIKDININSLAANWNLNVAY